MNAKQVTIYLIPGVFALLLTGATSLAQVPVDDNGNTVGNRTDQGNAVATGNEGIPLLARQDLQDLVGPVALYPDELLAIVLPAATYPLQIVQAARFLEDLKSDPNLKPDEDWDDAVVALLNYPEVIALLNEDLDWTWQLGEAVVGQQADVVNAVEDFRNTAYVAGNLQSDGYQNVSRDDGVIEISTVRDDVIYVPYYEPERVVVYQPTPVYNYYERPRPVYNYPYPASHAFNRGFFWGVTTAFTIGWAADNLSVYHHSYAGHPYFGRRYYDNWWYRRPSIQVHNATYYNGYANVGSRRYGHGDYWRPSRNHRLSYRDQRITHNSGYGGQAHNYRSDNVRYRSTNTRSANTHSANTHSSNTRSSNTRSSGAHSTYSRPQQTHESRNDRRRDAGNNTHRQPRNDERQARSNHNRSQQDRSQQDHSSRERSSQDNRSRERTANRGNSRGRDESRRSRH